ncbi:Uncharacterised protein [Mycobacteroides abscessus subsp. abscessus]|nr:Uncharacterised protein [Mycobacteroides abscessus]SHW56275.1 Uncharacterised protein [Mycobacteroides abscessus subsp. abscessus]SIJ21044.1 Uncharacterised protein [Mycobacteroides abscessus subsp. abscessus]SIL09213.1 Uncharacterised protein [Mycobacteroides abscessus subsp. abscessus]SLG34846.1 Uncharacterised protein [Mycobacteroides abscessus subsp. abscessus]
MEQGPELVDLSAGGLGLCEDSRQGGQGGAHAGVELSESAGELIGAVGEFGEVVAAGVAVGDRAGHLVSDLAVLPGQLRLIEAFPGGAGDSGDCGDTGNLGDAGGHFVEVGQSLAGTHVGGVLHDQEFGDDGVFAEVAVQQLVALVAGGGGGLAFAVVVADLDGRGHRR